MATISMNDKMLMDIQYIKANKKENKPDYLYIITKDTKTNKKKLDIIEEPPIDIYFTKPELRNHDYSKTYEHVSNLDKKRIKFKDIPFAIAEDMGPQGKQFLSHVFTNRDYNRLKELYLYPYVYGADYDIVSWYRIQWLLKAKQDVPKVLRKGFLDIEVDVLEVPGSPVAKSCPINAVTLFDDSEKICYTFILTHRPCIEKDTSKMSEEQKKAEMTRRKLYKNMHAQQEEMMENTDEFIKELHNTFDDSYKVNDYKLFFYKDERKMLVHLFQLINKLKLDFIDIWNISFDIPYIMDRMKALGLDPKEVMCHPDFPSKECYFKEDKFNFAIKNKSDNFILSSYTIFKDQMQLYASIRKGSSELRSYSLDYVSDVELGDKKLKIDDKVNFKLLAYMYFKKFIIYNIKDVLLQYGIEDRTGDLDTHYATAYMNATAYSKTHMPTVRLRNRQYISYVGQAIIPGENINIMNAYVEPTDDDEDETDDSFEGAVVADPDFNDYVGMELYGERTNNIHSDAIDLDMTAFYPSSIFAMNIEPSALIFKMIMNSTQFMSSGLMKLNGITNNFIEASEDLGKECIDNFQTLDYMSFATKWLNLPDLHEICKSYEKKVA